MKRGDIIDVGGSVALVVGIDRELGIAKLVVFPEHSANANIVIPDEEQPAGQPGPPLKANPEKKETKKSK